MCSVGGAGRAELDCSVLEEDWQRGQSYTAHWHSPALVPQHHRRTTVMQAERSAEHWEARRLLQRFLSGAINRNWYPPPKPHSTRRPHLSVSDTSAMETKVQRGPAQIQEEVRCAAVRPKGTVLEACERKTLVKITTLPRFLG